MEASGPKSVPQSPKMELREEAIIGSWSSQKAIYQKMLVFSYQKHGLEGKGWALGGSIYLASWRQLRYESKSNLYNWYLVAPRNFKLRTA